MVKRRKGRGYHSDAKIGGVGKLTTKTVPKSTPDKSPEAPKKVSGLLKPENRHILTIDIKNRNRLVCRRCGYSINKYKLSKILNDSSRTRCY